MCIAVANILRRGVRPDVYWPRPGYTLVTPRKPISSIRKAGVPGRPVSPRSWKSTDADADARAFFTKPRTAAVRELIQKLCSHDPYDHRCAAELARLVSRREPGVLAAYGDLLAEVAAELPMEEWQARGYVLVAAALNAMTRAQRLRLVPLVRTRLAEDRIAVRAMALEAFAILAVAEPALRDEAMELLETARHSPDFALRARARLMLPSLMKADKETRAR
jgi:hypothetical protein